MRPVDADALRERLQIIAYDDWNQRIAISFADACHEIIDIIEDQPTIEPPRMKGKWVAQNPLVDTEECSVCGYNIQSAEMETPFCPWCGACMSEGEEDE